MLEPTSPDTKAVLLLTSLLGAKSSSDSVQPLTASEYRKVARQLHELKCSPSALTSSDASSKAAVEGCSDVVGADRLRRLLARGLLLGQALERWSARGIWVASKLDARYPKRLRTVMRADAPPVLYGAGEPAICSKPALGVVGSRKVETAVIEHTEAIARFAADNDIATVSGGAKGVDRAAMLAALSHGGYAVGVLADSLEKAVVEPAYRDALRTGKLLLVSPFDPSGRFQIWTAMQRNKLIYAASDAVLVMESAVSEGGTWAGAIEQLEKYRYAPVFVRGEAPPSAGLAALQGSGADVWPKPIDRESFVEMAARAQRPQARSLAAGQLAMGGLPIDDLPLPASTLADVDAVQDSQSSDFEPIPLTRSTLAAVEAAPSGLAQRPVHEQPGPSEGSPATPAETLFVHVRSAILCALDRPRSATELAALLDVTKPQAKSWLDRMVNARDLAPPKRGLYAISHPDLPLG